MVIDRGKLVTKVKDPFNYKRFSLEEPVSPRAPLGYAVSWHAGDEHDEYGHICEDPIMRERMYSKRIQKMDIIRREIPEERRAQLYGSREPDILLVGWGSVKGPALEAARLLREKGVEASYLNVRYMYPLATSMISSLLDRMGADRVVAVEHSYGALVAKLIAMETGRVIRKSIVKFTGRPIYTHELVEAVHRILEGEERVVLDYGA
ncbi:hypothetical protein CF15_07520 [Pyrodictium occultum]|uniref:Transketolase C-terminal domain-containing protein n=1 Tax=Pyrodictium occultum TaxID=2309 RepID=A0A0V8RWX0_PYROC|nr:transketolase C-terminal domain-containing protein [Pyrodictium occultum]KSW12555.1 hypothetical protein CF15_07520 [Pyrodictium occultum]